jgi:hypothetical protein
MANHAFQATPHVQADLRQLRGFTGSCFTGHDHYLMAVQSRLDVCYLARQWQFRRVVDGWHSLTSARHPGHGCLYIWYQLFQRGRVFASTSGWPVQFTQLPAQHMLITHQALVNLAQ